MAFSHCYCTSSGQQWQYHIAHLHQVVQNGNFTLLVSLSDQKWLILHCYMTSKWSKNGKYHIATDNKWSRMAISHSYWHLVVNNGIFKLSLTSSGQEWQFHTANIIKWSNMVILHCYVHLMAKNGNITLLLTSSGQEWQLHIATDIYW